MAKFAISEALNYHSLAYFTADRAKNTDGKIIQIKSGRIAKHEQSHLYKSKTIAVSAGNKKSQNHSEHATRSILLENAVCIHRMKPSSVNLAKL